MMVSSSFSYFNNVTYSDKISLYIPPCLYSYLNTFPNKKFETSKLKEFTDDNFKFDTYGGKFSKRVENTVGKGEIAGYEQFLLFPQCFQKTCTADMYKPGLVWERVKLLLPFPTHTLLLMTLRKYAFENIVGKGENAVSQHLLLSPPIVFVLRQAQILAFGLPSSCTSCKCFQF